MPGTPMPNNDDQLLKKAPGENSAIEEPGFEAPRNEQNNKAPEPAPVWEITQTDKLNKKLLVSFLNRLNSEPVQVPEEDEESSEEE